MGQYLKDRKGFKKYDITDGEKSLTNPLTLHRLLHRDTMFFGGWKPYLFVDFILVSHQFNPTHRIIENQIRIPTNDKVWELHNENWGSSKIHQYLIMNGFEIGKNISSVNWIINKMEREMKTNQTIMLEQYKNLRLGIC